MTDFDLDRLGELWRKDPDPAEFERMRRSAAAISQRARRAQWADTLGTIATCAAMVALASLNHNPRTLLAAIAALLFLLFSFVRNRKLREAEIRMLTGTTEEMLDQSIERVEATRKRIRFNLGGGLLIVPFAVVLASTHGAARGLLTAAFHLPSWGRWMVLAVFGSALVLMIAHNVRAFMRGNAELERLTKLRSAYRRERDGTA